MKAAVLQTNWTLPLSLSLSHCAIILASNREGKNVGLNMFKMIYSKPAASFISFISKGSILRCISNIRIWCLNCAVWGIGIHWDPLATGPKATGSAKGNKGNKSTSKLKTLRRFIATTSRRSSCMLLPRNCEFAW